MLKLINYESKYCEKFRNWFFLLFRVGFGMFFLLSGLPKLQALLVGKNLLAGLGIPIWLTWIVALIEVIGGGLLVLGLLIMPAGALIGLVMLVATVMTTISPFNAKSFFLHWIYIFGAFYLATVKTHFASLDGVFCKNKEKKSEKSKKEN